LEKEVIYFFDYEEEFFFKRFSADKTPEIFFIKPIINPQRRGLLKVTDEVFLLCALL
jgi:hypothetical protein